ncbi:MAG: dockerin type I domain-containing protein [Planctomycetia bacterium]|jgi:hypothetical protein
MKVFFLTPCVLVLLLMQAVCVATIPDTPLQAYWTFDWNYSSEVNSSYYGGTAYGGSYTSITNTAGEYIRGSGALKLDSGPSSGNRTYIDIINEVADVTRDQQITVSAWYNYTDISGDGSDTRNFVWESSPDYSLAFGLRTDGSVTDAEWWFDSGINDTSGPAITSGAWNHAVMILDTETHRVQYYHNGVLRDDYQFIGTIDAMSGFHIGNHRAADGSRDFDGYIDDVAVYHGVLDADGVAGLYDGTYTPQTVPVLDQLPVPPPVEEPAPFTPGSWTMVQLPDTQIYTEDPTGTIFNQMTQWIVDNKEARNIGLVTHVGDITNHNTDAEWAVAKTAISKLDGEVPYVLCPGNHDYNMSSSTPRTTSKINNYFSASDNPLNDPATGGILSGYYEAGKLENAYYEFTAPDGRKMLIFALEFGPRQAVLDWVQSVAEQPSFSDHSAMVVTHAYLCNNDTRYDWDLYGSSQVANPHGYTNLGSDVHDGQEMWEDVVGVVKNFEMLHCGHVIGEANSDDDGVGYLASTGTEGNTVFQMLFNAQHVGGNGGDGWMRLLEFQPDGKTVRVKTYSPYLDSMGLSAWRVDEDDWFEFELSPISTPGDANRDGVVDASDATILAGNWQAINATWEMGDFNFDGIVNASDATILAGNWQAGTGTTVPEPGTLVLLAGLILAAVCFKRRY